MRKNFTITTITLVTLAILAIPAFPQHALASNCLQWSQQRRFLKSARCYRKKAQQMKHGKQLSRFAQSKKGRFLRNAAWAYQAAAKVARSRSKEAFHLESAIGALRVVLREKLCHRASRCQRIRAQIRLLQRRIKYIRLTIVTKKRMRARVTIRGYRFRKTFWSPPHWSRLVRPGRYRISVKYEGYPTKHRRITLGKKAQRKVQIAPPQRRSRRRLPKPRRPKPRRIIANRPRPKPVAPKPRKARVLPTPRRRPQPPVIVKKPAKPAAKKPVKKPVKKMAKTPRPRPPTKRKAKKKAQPNKARLAKAAPAKPRPQPKAPFPVGPVVLGSIAGALALGGGVVVLVGGLNHQGVQSGIPELVAEAANKSPEERRQLAQAGRSAGQNFQHHTTAETTWTAGWVIVGVGLTGATGALLWWLLSRNAHTTPPKGTQAPKDAAKEIHFFDTGSLPSP